MTLVQKLEQMLAEAERRYQGAAAMHAMSKVTEYGARVETLKEVLRLVR